MLRSTMVRVGLVLIALTLATAPVAAATSFRFVSPLNSDEEVPPNDSTATGFASFVISDDEQSVTYRLIVANINDVTQSHIHCGAPGVNGPVVVFLFGFDPVGVTENGILAEGTFTDANVIDRPDSLACPGGIANLDDLIEKIRTGNAYTNVHTIAIPGGEIRGLIR